MLYNSYSDNYNDNIEISPINNKLLVAQKLKRFPITYNFYFIILTPAFCLKY